MKRAAQPVLNEMERLWRNFVNCRAHFPCVDHNMVGQTAIRTAPYYTQQGFDVWLCFPDPLTKRNVEDFLAIGNWINQNFIVRLHALLESHRVLAYRQGVDSALAGHERVYLVKQLRNVFAHTSGHYDKNNRKHRKILGRMRAVLHSNTTSATDFPLGIDKELRALFDGCKQYVDNWAKRTGQEAESDGTANTLVQFLEWCEECLRDLRQALLRRATEKVSRAAE